MKPAHLLAPALLCAAVFPTVAFAASAKIPLAGWMVTSETAQSDPTYLNAFDATALLDEQALAGDPRDGVGGAPVRHWFPGWGAERFPASAVIDLRAEYDLTEIYLRDTSGGGGVTVSAGLPFAWTVLFTDAMGNYNVWNRHNVALRARYLRVTLTTPGVQPEEVVVYGTIAPGQSPLPEPPAVAHPRPAIDELIGTNAFIDDPLGRIEQAGHVREYHTWAWDEGNGDAAYPGFPANQNAWAPSWVGGWDFDQYYRNLARLGLAASPAMQKTPAWLRGSGTHDEMKPIPLAAGVATRDSLAPASYAEHADHLFQFAARYGALPVADAALKLRAGQPRVSGLGTLRYFENWNEPDKWWEGAESYFRPFELAAMSSADADGHLGTMGATLGVHAADPSARLVMGGLTKLEREYLKGLKLWFDFRRGGDFPFAAVNFHHYCNDAGGQGGGSVTTGISPEADGLRARAAALRDYRDRYLPGVKFWLSEFGWDRDPGSDQRAPALAGQTAEEIQARWLVRAWLEVAAGGVDRGFQFMLRDVTPAGDPNVGGRFNTSGLVGPKGSWAAFRAWYYTATLRQRLRGLHWHDELAPGDPLLRAYRFADEGGRVRALAVWSATDTGCAVPAFALPLPAGSTRATRIDFSPGSIAGAATELPIVGGNVSIDVGERPCLILLEGRNARARLPDRRLTLTAAQVTNEAAAGNPALLVDEQATAGDPDMGGGGAPTTNWSAGFSAASYPARARLDLGLRRHVTKIYLHDFSSAGAFDLETGAPGQWTFLSRDNLARYAAWSGHVFNDRTRHVRFTMQASSSNVAEVAVYARQYGGYGDWAERAFPGAEDFAGGEASPAADIDGDGASNLLEYVLGGDPRVAESDLAPVVAVSGSNLTLTYVRDLWLADVAWQVEWSTDLATWSTAGVSEATELVTADFSRRRAEVAIAGRAKLFLRLKATLTAAP